MNQGPADLQSATLTTELCTQLLVFVMCNTLLLLLLYLTLYLTLLYLLLLYLLLLLFIAHINCPTWLFYAENICQDRLRTEWLLETGGQPATGQ